MIDISRRSLLLGATAALFPLSIPVAFAANERVRIGVDVDVVSLDPRTGRSTTDYRVLDLLYDGLVRLNQDFDPQPNLATKWEFTDPTTLIVNIRDDVKFSDGTPLTAEDVAFTYSTVVDPQLASMVASLYAPIERVEATSPTEVKFTLKHAYAPLLRYLDLGIAPKHLAEAGHNLSADPVGSGPYKFVRWTKGSEMVLAAKDDYRGAVPGTKEIVFVPLADNTARAQALESGDLDMIMTPLSADDVHRLAADSRFNQTVMPGSTITYFSFNNAAPLLGDPKLRHALGMMIDQDVMLEQIYGGIDVPGTSILLPNFKWLYTTDIRQPTFDLEGAKKMLDELGWVSGAGGVREKDGQKLTITLSTNSEDPVRIQTIEYLQNVMQQAGVDAKVEIADFSAWITNVRAGRYDIALLSWSLLVDPDRVTYSQLTTKGALNWGSYSNAEVDAALNRGRAATDQAERAAAYHEAAKIISEEVPYYVLSYTGFYAFTAKAVSGGNPDDPRGFVRGLMAS